MTDDSLIAKLAEEFTAKIRAGKTADIELETAGEPGSFAFLRITSSLGRTHLQY